MTPGDKQVEPWSAAFDGHLQNSTVASFPVPAGGPPWTPGRVHKLGGDGIKPCADS